MEKGHLYRGRWDRCDQDTCDKDQQKPIQREAGRGDRDSARLVSSIGAPAAGT